MVEAAEREGKVSCGVGSRRPHRYSRIGRERDIQRRAMQDGGHRMFIVLIHWKIKPEQERVDEFLEFWRKTATVDNRRGLIGEFLTEACSTAEYGWITWQLTGCEGKYRSFVNIGYWNSAEEFHEQIGKYFETSTGPKEFEAEPRIRTVMNPNAGGWAIVLCQFMTAVESCNGIATELMNSPELCILVELVSRMHPRYHGCMHGPFVYCGAQRVCNRRLMSKRDPGRQCGAVSVANRGNWPKRDLTERVEQGERIWKVT